MPEKLHGYVVYTDNDVTVLTLPDYSYNLGYINPRKVVVISSFTFTADDHKPLVIYKPVFTQGAGSFVLTYSYYCIFYRKMKERKTLYAVCFDKRKLPDGFA